MVASAFANCYLRQGAQTIKPGAWFGHYEAAPEMSDDQMLAMMQQFAEVHNRGIKE